MVIRKVLEREVGARGLIGCYVASLSSRTVVYEGMLTPGQLKP